MKTARRLVGAVIAGSVAMAVTFPLPGRCAEPPDTVTRPPVVTSPADLVEPVPDAPGAETTPPLREALPPPHRSWTGLSMAGGSGLLDVRSAEAFSGGLVAVQAAALHYRLSAGSVPGDTHERDVTDGSLQLLTGAAGWIEAWAIVRGVRQDTDVQRAVVFLADGRAGAKLLAPVGPGGLRAGIALEANLPFGDLARGGSTDAVDPAATALLTVPLPLPGQDVRARVHVNVGYRAHGDDTGRTFEDTPLFYLEPVYPRGQNDRIDLRGAIEVRARDTALFAELVLDRLRHESVAYSEGPRFFNAGFRMSTPASTTLLVAARVSLATDDESTAIHRSADELYPDWQLGVAIAWEHRRDNAAPADRGRD